MFSFPYTHTNTHHLRGLLQLTETVATLEKRLVLESKRSEDLQLSIEEATFCGDELNVSVLRLNTPEFHMY